MDSGHSQRFMLLGPSSNSTKQTSWSCYHKSAGDYMYQVWNPDLLTVLTLRVTPAAEAWHCFTQKLNPYWYRLQLGISSQWQLIQPAVLQMPSVYKRICGSYRMTRKRLSWIGKSHLAIHTSLFLHAYFRAHLLSPNSCVSIPEKSSSGL